MMNREEKQINLSFPFGLYLKQLFSADTYVRYINPFSFWRRYRTAHLETCHQLNTVQYLEHCYKLDSPVTKQKKIDLNLDYIDSSINSLFKQAELNTIYIPQPQIKLKYRGVTYYTQDILQININIVKVDPDAVKLNSLGSIADSERTSMPKKSSNN